MGGVNINLNPPKIILVIVIVIADSTLVCVCMVLGCPQSPQLAHPPSVDMPTNLRVPCYCAACKGAIKSKATRWRHRKNPKFIDRDDVVAPEERLEDPMPINIADFAAPTFPLVPPDYPDTQMGDAEEEIHEDNNANDMQDPIPENEWVSHVAPSPPIVIGPLGFNIANS